MLISGAACSSAPPPAAALAAPTPGVSADIAWLASPLLEGRATGSAGNDSAALYIARSYVQIGLAGLFPSIRCEVAPCDTRYDQLFIPPPDVLKEAGIRSDAAGRNMGAMVPGSDSALRGEYVVIGAHFDHLGRTGYGALDTRTPNEPHLGADDNASGTAAVLELARRLARQPVRRSVVLVNFGAEELGLFGSKAFVVRPPVRLDSVVAMINIDMVGRLRRDRVYVYGLGFNREWRRLLEQANATVHLNPDLHEESGLRGTASDHDNFRAVGIPSIHFTTGTHAEYHTADDKWETIDINGEMRVITLVESLIRILGDIPNVGAPLRR
jgi:peptidase M28-like protein